jgi:hypothetical protein
MSQFVDKLNFVILLVNLGLFFVVLFIILLKSRLGGLKVMSNEI